MSPFSIKTLSAEALQSKLFRISVNNKDIAASRVDTTVSTFEEAKEQFEKFFNIADEAARGLRLMQKAYRNGEVSEVFLDDNFDELRNKVSNARSAKKVLDEIAVSTSADVDEYNQYISEKDKVSMTFGSFAPIVSRKVSIHNAASDYAVDSYARELRAHSGGTLSMGGATGDIFGIILESTDNATKKEQMRELILKASDIVPDDRRFVFVDIETTGFGPITSDIIEVGFYITDNNGKHVESRNFMFNVDSPNAARRFGLGASDVHHIGIEEIEDCGTFSSGNPDYDEVVELLNDPNHIIVAHNSSFEAHRFAFSVDGFRQRFDPLTLDSAFSGCPEGLLLDTCFMVGLMLDLENTKLASAAEFFGIDYSNAHRAYEDAKMTAEVFFNIVGDNAS